MEKSFDFVDTDEKPIINFTCKVAFQGDQLDGYSLSCRNCGNLLIKNTYDNQILGLLINCPECTLVNSTTARKVGDPIPTTKIILMKGTYNFSNFVNLVGKTATVVSNSEVENYWKEVGYKQNLNPTKLNELTQDFCQDIAERAKKLLDEQVYKRLMTTFNKSQKSATPKKDIHRIIRIDKLCF